MTPFYLFVPLSIDLKKVMAIYTAAVQLIVHFAIHTANSRWRFESNSFQTGGAGKARFNVATPTYEARTRPLHVQHTYYRIIFKQNPFNIISRGVQR